MSLSARFKTTRELTRALIEALEPEDCLLQTMADVSPPKWHLGHSAWFFETFVLREHGGGYRALDERYRALFNSYYEAVGSRPARVQRGWLSRPTLADVLSYRDHVDAAMSHVFERPAVRHLIELGIHHEQQHQELLVMDVKYNFFQNPLKPAYRQRPLEPCAPSTALDFQPFGGGVLELGHAGDGFAFDNEGPRHRRFAEPFGLATRLVTNAEMREFVTAGGYRTPSLWLSDGWQWVQANEVRAPLYWSEDAHGAPLEFTAHGEAPLDLNAPVCHVSGYEAAAFAAWAGARLPTELEWEVAAANTSAGAARALEDGVLHPRNAAGAGMQQLFGDLWQWTRSAYDPYPGFRASADAIGEYNGKFMCNQWVLRGGSCVTPRGHTRTTYRNFFYPHQRWPFTGIRLARDAS
jgi:ergothioneine biosynthesis protein EgtB